ncbi:TonB-dependent receptor plug domain-containing protein [Undibacterium sp. Di26W]|uniref:TonB-dependent receptor plug domain-containing protein n=1 Tax=Undibacterium sp. Di26W TaxID=3413035 RepID=UPI003BEFB9BA
MKSSCVLRKWHSASPVRGKALSALLVTAMTTPCYATLGPSDNFLDLSFDELANIRITSVSKKAENIAQAPASIFVITNEDIRRSGAASLPEALRLAPNLQMARVDARNYAVTARGFNSPFENKLLVLIDGRTVYSPLFSGVFWDAQDVVLEDIDRIEVISGAGATLWGANAVNGVINIITRSAKDTLGSLVSAGMSPHERNMAVRYGGSFANDTSYRVYAKHADNDDSRNENGNLLLEGWRRDQFGFRTDWEQAGLGQAFIGNAYHASLRQGLTTNIELAGANLLSRTSWKGADNADSSLQMYWDHTERNQPNAYNDHLDTLDLEFQHAQTVANIHNLVWGLGYRYAIDKVQNGNNFGFLPGSLNMHWANIFIQDEIRLMENLRLTLGLKFEKNSYTGLENLPNLRLAWEPADKHLLWAALSRSVRTPSRIDKDLFAPTKPFLFGGKLTYFYAGGQDFESEIAKTTELGYRGQLNKNISYSATIFYTEYDKLRTLEPGIAGLDAVFRNQAKGKTKGIEMWATWQANTAWRLTAGGVWQNITTQLLPGSKDTSSSNGLTMVNDADNYWMIRSSFDLAKDKEFDMHLRRVASLPKPAVPAYTSLDMRFGWKIRPDIELSLIGQNLLQKSHVEYGASPNRAEFERSLMVRVIWKL